MKCAVIVPFKNREAHLEQFAPALKKFIGGDVSYELFVIEQDTNDPCNIGRLRNIGFAETRKKFDYFIFHDVDMLPLSVDYGPVTNPTLLASEAEQFKYTMPFEEYFGGVVSIPKQAYEACNGYSNLYWGWGAEDCDFRLRLLNSGCTLEKRRGVFACLQHERDPAAAIRNNKRFQEWPEREKGNKTGFRHEGLTSLDYSIKQVSNHGLYTKIKVMWPKPVFY